MAGRRSACGGADRREAEVRKPAGRGLTDAEAADRLFISETTARTHLDRAEAGLGLAGRAQARVPAYETGLVTTGASGG
ncbi:LuxR C-terminal-related transcriptional regulator [Streptomyces glaucescens]|uniref:LuxR C-terminal-related transcriptional regulator n=1 Tax=Streptomyces glaucescens TaxID=1907 RepID=UPI000A38AA2A